MRGAGKLALGYFGKVAVERKADTSVVTEADRAVERYLVAKLLEIEPRARILGEEGTSAASPPRGEATWAIDPIDGTAVFVAGMATWSISVGLVRDGVADLGSVFLPVSGEMFLAGGTGPLLWNGVEVRRGDEPGDYEGGRAPDTWIGMPSNHHRRYRVGFPGKVRSLGSTAAHFAWASRGAAIAAVSAGRLWDLAGGLACCRASGVAVSYLSGAAIDFAVLLEGERTPEPILAAHPRDVEHLRRAIELVPLRRP